MIGHLDNFMRETCIYILILVIGCISWQCANRLSLEGGERDQQPPILNTDDSDENFQRNFSEREFELTFDEFVKINKPNEQIVISPPLQYSLTPVVRGKKIIFKFNPDEPLRENTTYNIQFGEAIQDITESNPVNNLRYVFSTGNVIDSMEVRVQVVDLNDNTPVLGAMVMLYETLSDTVIRKGRPTYFSRTDSSGQATVQNCRPGEYRVIALVDENRNYQFDLAEEKIGYIDTFIVSTLDEKIVHDVFVFSEIEPPYQLDVVKLDSQLYAIVVGGEIDYLDWSVEEPEPIETFVDKDTLYIRTPFNNDYIILSSDYSEPDTIAFNKIKLKKEAKNRFRKITPPRQVVQENNGMLTMEATWKNPIINFDENKLRLYNQAKELVQVEINTEPISDNGLKTLFSWNHSDMRDSIIFLPGAVRTWYGTNDTILLPLKPLKAESLSNLIVASTNLDSTLTYVLILRSTNGEPLYTTQIKEKLEDEWTIPGLFPAKYNLELITDYNGNGRRDGGWFDKRQIPEPSNVVQVDNLRPDWDVQVEISPGKRDRPKPENR